MSPLAIWGGRRAQAGAGSSGGTTREPEWTPNWAGSGFGPGRDPADRDGVSHNVEHILQLEVPIIVRLGEKKLPLRDVMLLVPGTILELPKAAESDLEMLVNNKVVGQGVAVKVGENFGLRITKIGDARARVMALGESPAASAGPAADAPSEDDDFAALAAAMLAGQ